MKDNFKNFQQNGVTYLEEWRDVAGYEGLYQVSNLGNVRGLTRKNSNGRTVIGIKLKPTKTKFGYLTVGLWSNFKLKTNRIHRIVATAFIFNPENKPYVNHIDGNKTNNRVENLEWATRLENEKHALENGLKKRRDGHRGNKLLEKDVILIRERYWYDGGKKSNARGLANEYGVDKSLILAIIRRDIWTHI